MDRLIKAIHTTPIIDHHAHNLLAFESIEEDDRLGMFSEAQDAALEDSRSALPHIRGVRQLAQALGCPANWDSVKRVLAGKYRDETDAWVRHCFSGIETVLIDDGFMSEDVYPYEWHDWFVRSKCKRVVRIEVVVEEIVEKLRRTPSSKPEPEVIEEIEQHFVTAIEKAIGDAEVAGFKSVNCYRTGLAIPPFDQLGSANLSKYLQPSDSEDFRLEDEVLCPYFVHLTAQALKRQHSEKPFQFHTGLGDWDINLNLGSPVHLQPFLEWYPEVQVVFLHASWPFTKEAGYLAAVYPNAYLDIGEVFPHISQDGQDRMIREAFDICPSEKLLWSTDAHSFAETYFLATLQWKEGLQTVLCEYVEKGAISVDQAIKIVQDLYFNTANRIYKLGLDLIPIEYDFNRLSGHSDLTRGSRARGVGSFHEFLEEHSSVKYLRLQWVDYTSTVRARLLPIKKAIEMFEKSEYLGITQAVFGLLQMDVIVEGFNATGEYKLVPDLDSLRLSDRPAYATVQCELKEQSGEDVNIDPRTVLRKQVQKAEEMDVRFNVGFEIEVIFMHREIHYDQVVYGTKTLNAEAGHSWSAVRALHDDKTIGVIEHIVDKFEEVGIELVQFHAESAPGQYEFALGPLPPVAAVDTLIAARDIIVQEAASADFRATLYPKPYPNTPGSGEHMHLSFQPEENWQSFYAGVLESLPTITAFTYPNNASYERVVDGVWAGGTWVCWGHQNRETPLRQISASHFEIKCIDGLAQPYLSLAAIIAAGLNGLATNKELNMGPCVGDPALLSDDERKELGIVQKLPQDFEQAIRALGHAHTMREALGYRVVQTYELVKQAEGEFLGSMSPEARRNWLVDRY